VIYHLLNHNKHNFKHYVNLISHPKLYVLIKIAQHILLYAMTNYAHVKKIINYVLQLKLTLLNIKYNKTLSLLNLFKILLIKMSIQ